MEITLTDIERESYKNSPLHRLDGRIKILTTIAIIIFVVNLPRMNNDNFMRLSIIEAYLIILIMVAKLNLVYVILRFIAILPFGLGMVIIQPFVRQPFIDSFTPYPLSLPFGLSMTYEGIEFGLSLLLKFVVCVTAIILFSSTTKMNDMVISARRLGIPKEFTLIMTMMVRYLFLFWSILKRIRVAQNTRLFNIWNKNVTRKWILTQVGNTISSLLVRSYEQGERTYISMLCRGYGSNKDMYIHKSKLKTADFVFTIFTVGTILGVYLYI